MTADSEGRARAPDGDDRIARLIAVPLGDFVEERKKLAASLKSLGRRDEAQAVAKLAKPSSALWTVNQVARRERAAIQRLAELTAAMQGARHASDDYAALVAEHRDVLRSLREAAEQILVEAKIGVSPALLEKIVHTLRAGMADDDARAAIENARLLHEIGELDFASLVGAGGGARAATPRIVTENARPAPAAPATHGKHAAGTAAAETEKAHDDDDRARAREAEARAREEERERARARAAAAREAEHLRAKADTARKRVRDEERAIEAARRALAEGEARLAKARAESDELERALQAALAASRGQPD